MPFLRTLFLHAGAVSFAAWAQEDSWKNKPVEQWTADDAKQGR